jgi:hypothetical protein
MSIGSAVCCETDTPGQHRLFFIEQTCSWHHRLLYCTVEQKHPWAAKAPTPTATCCLFIPYVYFGKEVGVGEAGEKIEGQQFTRGVKNTNMTDCISSLLTVLNTSTEDI